MKKQVEYVVSACLAGIPCRFDEQARKNEYVAGLVKEKTALPACPERLGGLKSPRIPSEIKGGDGHDVLSGAAQVYNKDGDDITDAFVLGARRFLELVQKTGARQVILKSKSPSCGATEIYDGSFSGRLAKGCGVTCALLQKNGIDVLEMDESEEK
ncbi:MAG: DUF523 domain-containing protein [Christensenellaceae bacterium]